MSIKVLSEVDVYELGGKERASGAIYPPLFVRNHWNRRTLVVLQFGNGVQITVGATDLEHAIRNATSGAPR